MHSNEFQASIHWYAGRLDFRSHLVEVGGGPETLANDISHVIKILIVPHKRYSASTALDSSSAGWNFQLMKFLVLDLCSKSSVIQGQT